MKENKSARHKRKFRLLFDSAFAKPNRFKKLKHKANLAHVRHTYGLSPTTEDKDIYQLATEEERLVVTIDEDFKRLAKPKQAGIIFVNPYLSNDQIDDVIVGYISGKNPDDFLGKATKI